MTYVYDREKNTARVRAYRKTAEGKKAAYRTVKKYRITNKHKQAAWDAVKWALKTGEIVRGPCEECGNPQVDAHHHAGYDEPLEVIWLCKLHHKRTHVNN